MIKIQAALKEVHREKDQLERKLEEMENNGGAGNQQSTDLLKLQEIENGLKKAEAKHRLGAENSENEAVST